MVGDTDGTRAGSAVRPRRARLHPRWILLGQSLLLAGCSGEKVLGDYPPITCDLSEPPADVSDEHLSIATFWAADERELAAFQKLVGRVDEDRYFVSTDRMPTRVDSQRHIDEAFERRQLPDLFQVNGGSDVLRWVHGRDESKIDVCALDHLRDTYDWGDAYFAATLDPVSCSGRLYGLPVGIHHLNVLFYNHELLAKLVELAEERGQELTPPSALTSPGQLVALLEQVADLDATTPEGEPIVPLALGAHSDWPLTVAAFENVLLGLGGRAYEDLWMGGLEGDDGSRERGLRQALGEMLDVLQGLARSSNFEARTTWQDALRQVGSGQALFTIMGDWGYAQLDEETKSAVETVSFPGTSGTFVYTPDSFAVPRKIGENGFPARSFLHDVVEDKSALLDFSNAKHSTPPRRDLDDSEIASLNDDGLRDTYEEFSRCSGGAPDCRLLLAVSGLGPPPGADPCLDEVDALLALAVTDKLPSATLLDERTCPIAFPETQADAKVRLTELLLDVGRHRFAASCR
jgi:ABC-type glycerol-3-phosphate transport system substrate-binding protein